MSFVLPDGFQGPFLVVEDANAPPIERKNGDFVVSIPESRIVRVKSLSLLRDWHQERASYRNGKTLPVGPHAGADVGTSVVALRSRGIGAHNDRPDVAHFFVGTESDAYEYDFRALENVAVVDLQ